VGVLLLLTICTKSETTYVCDPLPSWNKSVFEIQMTRRQETDNKITNNVSTTALQHHKDTRNIATSAAATSTTTTTTTITRRCDSFFFSGAVRAFILDWLCTILIGALVVSFWRGSWLLLDLYLCQQSQTASLVKGETFCLQSTISDTTRYQSAWISYLVGVMLLSVSLVAHSRRIWYVPTSNHLTVPKSIQRVCLVYMFGIASVLIWRGIWYASDLFFWPNKNNPALSYTVTMCLGFFGCFGIGCGASLLAPPSLFFLDGPGHSPPPIGLTILEAYYTVTLSKYTKMPPQTLWKRILDVLMSFMILPILVVWFWRGWWGLLDVILWGFTQERADLHRSLIWGSILALVMLFLGSNDAMYLLPKVNNKTCLSRIIGRLKSTILALATVSFWRVVWYVWDDLGGNGTTTWSAWLSHALGVIGLLAMGCFSCIAASPTTVGVDALTHDDALEEPLFHSVPIPSESIRFMAIAKKPGDFGGLATPTSRRDDGDQTMERVPSRRFQSTFLCFTTGTNQTMTLVDVCPDELCVSRRSLQKREHSIQFIRSR
jgi:hypothetical protein